MDSANIQRGLNPPLNEVSFNAGGLSNREIADRLGLTANTVKGYIKNIYGKLGANRRVQVAARAKELGLLSPEQVLSSRSL
jgi:DNA-binding NarL/FixJ family response regulator